MSVSDAHILSTTPLDPKDAKWLKMTSIKYADPTGRARLWEAVERTTKPASADVDAVGIVAVLDDPAGAPPAVVLQRQFRPPTGRVTIEFPAGLVDAGESAAQSGLRELAEETGYVGELVPGGLGLPLWNDPGLAGTTVRMVHVRVDLARPENAAPRPRLEDGEFIECFAVPLAGLLEACRRFVAEGYAVDARVGGLAEGIDMGRRWGLL